jgi:MoaA/NifB/PqqE/SkfB family radical SAM enzyme
MSKYEGDNTEELLRTFKELYDLGVAQHGEDHERTIITGQIYSLILQNANREDEARELLTKLLATSKQILGSHHKFTKEIESALKKMMRQYNTMFKLDHCTILRN